MFTCDETLKFCYGYPVARQHTYTLEAIRPKLREALQHLADGDDVILTRHGKPIAALITPDDHARLRALPRNQERPMHVISIYNQAGGAGKTTLTRDLGYALTRRGYRVLLVDMDPQASLTRWLGLFTTDTPRPPAERLDQTVFPVLSDPDADLPTPQHAFDMDIIPANSKLTVGDSILYDNRDRLTHLRNALRRERAYDFVLLDAPPGRSAMALAAVAASDHLIIPVNVSKSLDNIGNVTEFLRDARTFSPNLSVLAFVMHSYMAQTKHHRDVYQALQEDLRAVAPTTTPISHKATLYNDASIYQQPIAVYAPRHSPKAEYDQLAHELLTLLNLTPQDIQ